jgi:PAS domain S-box-containing protein
MADFDGRYFASNSAFRNMLGYTERELYRLRFDDVTYEGDCEANLLLASELVGGKRQHFEIEKRYRRKDGTLVWARQHVALVPGMQGVAPFWLGVVEDITERKRVEEELRLQKQNFRESESRLQAFFENSPNMIFMKDREGRYLSANQECKRALSITQEVKGKRDDELFSTEQAVAFQAHDRQVLEAGVPMEFEEVALQQDGPHTSIVNTRCSGECDLLSKDESLSFTAPKLGQPLGRLCEDFTCDPLPSRFTEAPTRRQLVPERVPTRTDARQ